MINTIMYIVFIFSIACLLFSFGVFIYANIRLKRARLKIIRFKSDGAYVENK